MKSRSLALRHRDTELEPDDPVTTNDLLLVRVGHRNPGHDAKAEAVRVEELLLYLGEGPGEAIDLQVVADDLRQPRDPSSI